MGVTTDANRGIRAVIQEGKCCDARHNNEIVSALTLETCKRYLTAA
jgi:hypothetical protein